MKNNSSDNKKILAPVLTILILLVIAFFSIRALNNLGKEINENKIPENTNNTDVKIPPETTVKETIPEDKVIPEESVEVKDTGCTWKTIDREVPTYILDEEKTTVTEKKIINYTYEYVIQDETERNIKKTIDGKSYESFTTYNKDLFESFYENFALKGWFLDTGISKYESADSGSSFKIENTGNITGTYTVLRVYTSEKDNRYYDEKPTSTRVEIKAGNAKTITFENSVICYVLGNSNETAANQQIILMKDFMKKRPYGMSQEDLIIFPNSGKNIACVRPYFIVIPDTYQKEETNSEEIVRQFYRATTKRTQEIVCE